VPRESIFARSAGSAGLPAGAEVLPAIASPRIATVGTARFSTTSRMIPLARLGPVRRFNGSVTVAVLVLIVK
jgi:hypothetical protein